MVFSRVDAHRPVHDSPSGCLLTGVAEVGAGIEERYAAEGPCGLARASRSGRDDAATQAAPISIASMRTVLRRTVPFCAVLLVWALCHPFRGVAGDGLVYMSRAVADLDPSGAGRDLMFVHDGQSGFSIFRLIAAALVAALGMNLAALVLTLLNGVAWIGAMAALAHAMTNSRATYVLLAFTAVLPLDYGAYDLLNAGEILPTPRPLAEAFTLLALAAVLRGRWSAVVGFLLIATVLHPLMALAGLATVALTTAARHRGCVVGGLVLGVAVAIVAFLHVPLADRLTSVVDPQWDGLLRERHPYLFPTLWPPDPYARVMLSVVTLFIASRGVAGRIRHLLLAAAAVGPIGIAASLLFGDVLHLLLLDQIQLWRMEWLTSVLAAASLALCVTSLWPAGTVPRLVLGLLVFGWVVGPGAALTGTVAAFALALYVVWKWKVPRLRASWVLPVLTGFAAVVALRKAGDVIGYVGSASGMLSPGQDCLRLFANTHLLSAPVVLLAAVWLLDRRLAGGRLAWAVLAGTASLAIASGWDIRTPYVRFVDDGDTPELSRIVASHPGEVMWLNGDMEPLTMLHRPSWASPLQAAGGVFSRPLTLLAHHRAQAAFAAGMTASNDVAAFAPSARYRIPQMTKRGIGQLCARPDAPGWIVAPLLDQAPLPAEIIASRWRMPVKAMLPSFIDGVLTWHSVTQLAFAACAEQTGGRR